MTEPWLTAELPGTGGRIKETPDDFRVDEIPLYTACGEGEHLFIEIEKRNLTTHDLLRRAARLFAVPERDIGYAGLKDARATTRQTISIPLLDADRAKQLEDDQIRVLSAARHRNKLRPGHLHGNRFTIRVRDVAEDATAKATAICAVLSRRGVPNRFGSQRYGALGNSHLIGQALLRKEYDQAIVQMMGDPERITNERWREAARLFRDGKPQEAEAALPGHCRYERQVLSRLNADKSPQQALRSLPKSLQRLYLSAYQSYLFDRVVSMRLATLDSVWPGDFAYKHDNGACFFVEDVASEQERAGRFEISASGPIYGYKSTLARGQSGILEESLLESEGLALTDFRLGKGLDMPGERRPLRVPLEDMRIEAENDGLRLQFSLPKGSYATSVLREITKSDAPQD